MMQDIDDMNAIVEQHHISMEDEMQNLMRKIKRRLIKEQDQHYQPIIEKLERKLAEQNLKNAAEEKKTDQLQEQLDQTDQIIKRFLSHLSVYRVKDKSANQRSRVFKAWADLASGKSVMTKAAAHLYLEEPMRRILFKRWVSRMRKVRLQRQKRELRRSCEKDLRMKETEAAQRITALQAELDAVKELLIEHEKQHGEMQQKLRRAFMRGVVNLNLEAMDVFGEIPTVETVKEKSPTITQVIKDNSDDEDDFFVEPAPRISVVRHH